MHTLFFFLSLYISLTRRHARIQHENQETALSLFLSSSFFHEAKFLETSRRIFYKSPRADSRMRWRDATTRLSLFFFLLITFESHACRASFATREKIFRRVVITACKYRYRSQKEEWSTEIFFLSDIPPSHFILIAIEINFTSSESIKRLFRALRDTRQLSVIISQTPLRLEWRLIYIRPITSYASRSGIIRDRQGR